MKKILVVSEKSFQLVETVKLFADGCSCIVSRYIHIPPSTIIVHAIPIVSSCSVRTGYVSAMAKKIILDFLLVLDAFVAFISNLLLCAKIF